MKCNYCGNEVPDGSLTCPSCGGAIQQPQAASQQQAPQGAPPGQQTVVVVQQGPAPVPKSRTVYILLAFFLGTLGLGIVLIGPAVKNQARERARTISCVSNLKQIGMGLALYADDFYSRYPVQDNARGLDALRSTGVLTYHAAYVCPSSTTTAGSGEEPLTDANCDYIYLGGLFYTDWTQDCPIVIERPGSHVGNSVNILYAGGYVNNITLPDSVQTVTDLLQYLEEQATNPKVKAFLQKKQQTVF